MLTVGVGMLSKDLACLTWWFAHYPSMGVFENGVKLQS